MSSLAWISTERRICGSSSLQDAGLPLEQSFIATVYQLILEHQRIHGEQAMVSGMLPACSLSPHGPEEVLRLIGSTFTKRFNQCLAFSGGRFSGHPGGLKFENCFGAPEGQPTLDYEHEGGLTGV